MTEPPASITAQFARQPVCQRLGRLGRRPSGRTQEESTIRRERACEKISIQAACSGFLFGHTSRRHALASSAPRQSIAAPGVTCCAPAAKPHRGSERAGGSTGGRARSGAACTGRRVSWRPVGGRRSRHSRRFVCSGRPTLIGFHTPPPPPTTCGDFYPRLWASSSRRAGKQTSERPIDWPASRQTN